MSLFFLSLFAGALTILAPCVLPLLPVIVGGAIGEVKNRYAPYIITASLGVSVIIFTLVLKVSTAFIRIPPSVWSDISGGVLVVLGLLTIFPMLWARLVASLKFEQSSNKLLAKGYEKKNFAGDVVMGFALGPVFSTCSPTYFVILATILPQNFGLGLIDLLAYATGLCAMLLLVSLLGQRFASKLEGASDPGGWFKRSLGALFVVIGVFIIFGLDKTIETQLLNSGIFDVTKIETRLLGN